MGANIIKASLNKKNALFVVVISKKLLGPVSALSVCTGTLTTNNMLRNQTLGREQTKGKMLLGAQSHSV